MAYDPINFKDGSTPLDASNFNKMDAQIAANADAIDTLNNDLANISRMPMMYYRGSISTSPDNFMSSDDSGIYYANNYSAVTGASNWGYLFVVANNSMTSQFFIDSAGRFFWRSASGNPQSWGSWNQGTGAVTTALNFVVEN